MMNIHFLVVWQAINDFKLYAIDEEMRTLPNNVVADFIQSTMESEGLTAKQFRKKYTYYTDKQREKYQLGKYKEKEYDVMVKQQAEKQLGSKTIKIPRIQMVESTTK